MFFLYTHFCQGSVNKFFVADRAGADPVCGHVCIFKFFYIDGSLFIYLFIDSVGPDHDISDG